MSRVERWPFRILLNAKNGQWQIKSFAAGVKCHYTPHSVRIEYQVVLYLRHLTAISVVMVMLTVMAVSKWNFKKIKIICLKIKLVSDSLLVSKMKMRHWPIAIATVVSSTVMAAVVSCNWFKYDNIIRRTDADDGETNPLNINIPPWWWWWGERRTRL